jgi:hypothetical protein
MLTRTRTAIITLVAAGSFAAAAIAPAASQAMFKDPYVLALECEQYRAENEVFSNAAKAAEEKGEQDKANYYWGVATQIALIGKGKHCAWVAASTSSMSDRPTVGQVVTSPPPAPTPPVVKKAAPRPVTTLG